MPRSDNSSEHTLIYLLPYQFQLSVLLFIDKIPNKQGTLITCQYDPFSLSFPLPPYIMCQIQHQIFSIHCGLTTLTVQNLFRPQFTGKISRFLWHYGQFPVLIVSVTTNQEADSIFSSRALGKRVKIKLHKTLLLPWQPFVPWQRTAKTHKCVSNHWCSMECSIWFSQVSYITRNLSDRYSQVCTQTDLM